MSARHGLYASAFMFKHYSVRELGGLGRQALRFFFPPLADKIKVLSSPPPPLANQAEGGVDHPATAVCATLLLGIEVRCSDLPQLENPELRREVDARLRALNVVLSRTRGWWTLSWNS